MIEDWPCKRHQSQKISFICTGNVWHFEPLCNACIPEHTKNHPKNIKIQLQNIKQLIPKATYLKQKVSAVFEERLKRWGALSDIKDVEWAYIKSLNFKRDTVIKEVNVFFDELIAETRKRRVQEEFTQYQNLAKIGEQIKQKISFFKKDDYSDINNFCSEIKKYYFKENLEIYVQQMEEVLREYQEKIIKYDPFAWSKDLPQKLKKLLIQSYKLQDQQRQKPDAKKQSKKKQPIRKRCPNCKEQMQYLTEWKKHLVCRSCGGKQRNYVKNPL